MRRLSGDAVDDATYAIRARDDEIERLRRAVEAVIVRNPKGQIVGWRVSDDAMDTIISAFAPKENL